MIDGYRQAAAYAAAGGIDGVEVCAGFDYLPTQFLSPHANTRTDSYGGSFENRLRFLREVCQAMREGIGGGAVGCRLTDESGSWDGNSHEELARAAGILADEGLIDYLSIALGGSSTYRGSSWIVPPVPVEHNAVAGFARTHEGSRERPRDRDRPHRRPRRRRRDDRARRLRRLRHDAGADHRPLDAGTCGGRPGVHDLHRLQPGVHRPLPRRHPDRLHDQPLDRVRVDAAAPHPRSQPGNGGRGRRRTGWRIRGRLRGRPRTPGDRVRARRGGGRSDAAGTERVRPRRDRAGHGAHGRGLAGGGGSAAGGGRRRRRGAGRVARPRDPGHRRRALRRRHRRHRPRLGRAGRSRHRPARHDLRLGRRLDGAGAGRAAGAGRPRRCGW